MVANGGADGKHELDLDQEGHVDMLQLLIRMRLCRHCLPERLIVSFEGGDVQDPVQGLKSPEITVDELVGNFPWGLGDELAWSATAESFEP